MQLLDNGGHTPMTVRWIGINILFEIYTDTNARTGVRTNNVKNVTNDIIERANRTMYEFKGMFIDLR